MNETATYPCECICSTDIVYTILSVLGFIVPLAISEVLPFSNCEAQGIFHALVKLIKNRKKITPIKN